MRELDEIRVHSDAGALFERVLDLEFSIEHFHLSWSDVTAEEVKALQILSEERDKRKREVQERDSQESAMRSALIR